MNAGVSQAMESFFGPASKKIDISSFIESSHELLLRPQEEGYFSDDIVDECSVADIQGLLNETWSNPLLSAHLTRNHDSTISVLHAAHSAPGQKSQKSSKRSHLPDHNSLPVEVTDLQEKLDAVTLKSFSLKPETVHFMRTSRNSDKNILPNPRHKFIPAPEAEQPEAVITISVYNRLQWGPSYITRSSQHSFLSSHTLQDVYDSIVRESKNLPSEAGIPVGETGCFICIEDIAYGDGMSEADYAMKLIKLLDSSRKKSKRTVTKATTSLRDTTLSSLTVRIGEPYWLIHSGNCEHFVLIDQVRLLHPSDSRSGYPITLQIAPAILDLCRACNKVPANLSIVGDVRLGESPCLLCGPCWRSMGEGEDESVVVLLLAELSYQ